MICLRCNQEPTEHVYHTKNCKGKAYPVGTPGKHVRRWLCACGCKAVEIFHVLDYDKCRTHATTSLLFSQYFDLKAETKKRGSGHGYA